MDGHNKGGNGQVLPEKSSFLLINIICRPYYLGGRLEPPLLLPPLLLLLLPDEEGRLPDDELEE
jgi:hypothetical protein